MTGGREGEWIDSQNNGQNEQDFGQNSHIQGNSDLSITMNGRSSRTDMNLRKRQLVEEYEEGRRKEHKKEVKIKAKEEKRNKNKLLGR